MQRFFHIPKQPIPFLLHRRLEDIRNVSIFVDVTCFAVIFCLLMLVLCLPYYIKNLVFACTEGRDDLLRSWNGVIQTDCLNPVFLRSVKVRTVLNMYLLRYGEKVSEYVISGGTHGFKNVHAFAGKIAVYQLNETNQQHDWGISWYISQQQRPSCLPEGICAHILLLKPGERRRREKKQPLSFLL